MSTALVGIGHRIFTGHKDPTPWHGAWDTFKELPTWSLALAAAAAVLLILGAFTARTRRPQPEPEEPTAAERQVSGKRA